MPSYHAPGSRKGNRTWTVRGYVDGSQREIATTARDRRGAESQWLAFVDALRASRQPADPLSFRAIADGWARGRRAGKADLRRLDRLCAVEIQVAGRPARFGDLRVGEIRQSHVHAAAQALFPTQSNATRNREAVVPAATVLHAAAEDELIGWLRIRKFRENEPARPRPADGVPALLLANTEGRERLLLTFLVYQGWRIGETLGWRAEQRDMQARRLSLYVPKVGKWISVPMHSATFEALANADLPDAGPVWPWPTRHRVYNWLRPLCRRLGVAFTPHMARRDFASTLAELDASNEAIAAAGSWTSARTVELYTAISDAAASATIARIPLRGKHRN